MPKVKISATIENKDLKESIHYLFPDNPVVKYETIKEAEESSKEEVVSMINGKTAETKQQITVLQKAGYNLHLETIKLIAIPLKTKVWLSTLTKKDLEKIFEIINEVNKIISPIEKENEKKILEKERLEKIADKKEKESQEPVIKNPNNKPSP